MNLTYATKGGIPSELPREYSPGVIRDDFLAVIYEVRALRQAIQAYLIDVTKDITGIVPPANLGTGAASATTVLSGASTYVSLPTGGVAFPRRWGYDVVDNGGERFGGIGNGLTISAGSGTLVTDSTSIWRRMTSAATTGSQNYLFSSAGWCQMDHNPTFQLNFRTGANIANIRINIGILDNSQSPANSDTYTHKLMMFRYSTAAADPGWVGVTSDATNTLVTGNIANIAASTVYQLKITSTGGGTSVTFNVNGATQTLTPAAAIQGTLMATQISAFTLENVAKVFDFDNNYIEAA